MGGEPVSARDRHSGIEWAAKFGRSAWNGAVSALSGALQRTAALTAEDDEPHDPVSDCAVYWEEGITLCAIGYRNGFDVRALPRWLGAADASGAPRAQRSVRVLGVKGRRVRKIAVGRIDERSQYFDAENSVPRSVVEDGESENPATPRFGVLCACEPPAGGDDELELIDVATGTTLASRPANGRVLALGWTRAYIAVLLPGSVSILVKDSLALIRDIPCSDISAAIACGSAWTAVELQEGVPVQDGAIRPSLSGSNAVAAAAAAADVVVDSAKRFATHLLRAGEGGAHAVQTYWHQWRGTESSSGAVSADSSNAVESAPEPGQRERGGNAGAVGVYHAVTGDLICSFRPHTAPIQALCFDRSGSLLCTASETGRHVKVFRLVEMGKSSFRAVQLYSMLRGWTTASVSAISLSSDCRWLAASTSRGTVHMFPCSPFGGKPSVSSHASSSSAQMSATASSLASLSHEHAGNDERVCELEAITRLHHSGPEDALSSALSLQHVGYGSGSDGGGVLYISPDGNARYYAVKGVCETVLSESRQEQHVLRCAAEEVACIPMLRPAGDPGESNWPLEGKDLIDHDAVLHSSGGRLLSGDSAREWLDYLDDAVPDEGETSVYEDIVCEARAFDPDELPREAQFQGAQVIVRNGPLSPAQKRMRSVNGDAEVQTFIKYDKVPSRAVPSNDTEDDVVAARVIDTDALRRVATDSAS